MRKTNWIKSPFIPISIIVIVGAIILACGDMGDEDDFGASFFPPEITQNGKYAEFFYTPHSLYLSGSKPSYIADFNFANIDEWESYFKNKITDKDLGYLIYTARPGEIDTLIFSIKRPGYPIGPGLKGNSILKVSDTRSALDFLYYVGFAKRCEKYAAYENAYWYDDDEKAKDPRKDLAGMAKLEEGGMKQITNTNSPFVQQRYAFQVLRLYFASRDFDKCIQYYTQQKSVLEYDTNTIKYRAMGYLAGAYYGTKQFGKADYLYSLIYDHSDIMRISAYLSFHPQEDSDWKQTLAMAKTNREKEVLWQMCGIYGDALDAMKEIYILNPKSDLLDLLLARAISIEEGKFIGGIFSKEDIIKYDSLAYLGGGPVNKELVGFVKSVADKGNTINPCLWNLASGYLLWASDTNIFQKYLDKAKSEAGGDRLIYDEARLISLINKMDKGKTGSPNFENSILPELRWLRDSIHAEFFPLGFANQYMRSELAYKYSAIGDSVKYTCFSTANKKDIIQDVYFLNEMEEFIDKKSKTPFEQYALSELTYSKRDLIEIEAVNLLYNDKFKSAYAKLNEDDSAGNESLYGFDPLDIQINDCHDCDAQRDSDVDPIAAADTSTFHTKKGFIKRMIQLENSFKTDPAHLAENYFLFANGLYNMTYFGNNRVLYDSKATAMEYEYFGYPVHSERVANTGELVNPLPVYDDCSKAEEYYNKAINASNNPELKAKCCFMAAKCEQNMFFLYKPVGHKGDFKAGKYFAMLKANYSKTQYYREIIKECGYFRTYLGSK
jgi:hypothetical protein